MTDSLLVCDQDPLIVKGTSRPSTNQFEPFDVSMRLPRSVVVHREQYDDSAMEAEVAAYDERRRAREPKAASGLKNIDIYPPRDGVC